MRFNKGLRNITGCDPDTMKDATMKYHEEAGIPVVNRVQTSCSERIGAGFYIILGILVLMLVFGVVVPKIANGEDVDNPQAITNVAK